MKNTKKLLCSLYAVASVIGGATLSGCQTDTQYIYVYPDGTPVYNTPVRPTRTSNSSSVTGDILSGIFLGLGAAL